MVLTGFTRLVAESAAAIAHTALLVGRWAFPAVGASANAIEGGLVLDQLPLLGESGCNRVAEKAELLLLAERGLVGIAGLRRWRKDGKYVNVRSLIPGLAECEG